MDDADYGRSIGFNPRSRARSDVPYFRQRRRWAVSIHAPEQGATQKVATFRGLKVEVSIHAPEQGATVARIW